MFSLILIPAKCFSSFIIMWLNRSKNIFSKYFYVLPIQPWIWSNSSNSYFTILWCNVVSFSWKPERLIVLSWLQSRQPPKKTINTNMMDVNAKQRWLQGDWFSSIQLAFSEGMTAVKANQPLAETQHVPHLLHVPNRYVPIYLSRGNMAKSSNIYLIRFTVCCFSDAEHLPRLRRQMFRRGLTFS